MTSLSVSNLRQTRLKWRWKAGPWALSLSRSQLHSGQVCQVFWCCFPHSSQSLLPFHKSRLSLHVYCCLLHSKVHSKVFYRNSFGPDSATLQAVTPGGLLDTCPHFTKWHLVASMATSLKSCVICCSCMLLPKSILQVLQTRRWVHLPRWTSAEWTHLLPFIQTGVALITLSQTRSLTQTGDKIYSVNDFTDARPALMGRTICRFKQNWRSTEQKFWCERTLRAARTACSIRLEWCNSCQ